MSDNTLNETKIINEIFLKAARNPAFRDKMINSPEIILEQYNLSNTTKEIIIKALRE
jgi:hypothetical protein